MSQSKYVYFFGEGKADGSAEMRALLGGKGANLAEMTNLGIPVPPRLYHIHRGLRILLCKSQRISSRT